MSSLSGHMHADTASGSQVVPPPRRPLPEPLLPPSSLQVGVTQSRHFPRTTLDPKLAPTCRPSATAWPRGARGLRRLSVSLAWARSLKGQELADALHCADPAARQAPK